MTQRDEGIAAGALVALWEQGRYVTSMEIVHTSSGATLHYSHRPRTNHLYNKPPQERFPYLFTPTSQSG